MSARHQTRRWRLLANAAKARDGWRCQRPGCGSMAGLEAHHRDRRSAQFWNLGAIQTLCRTHHIEHHRAERRRKTDPAVRAWANALEELRV